MKLDEAIKHCKEVARIQRQEAEMLRENGEHISPTKQPYNLNVKACLACAKDHEQLAEWLTELQERREADRWISITEKKPDELVAVNITYVNHNPETYYDDIKDKPFTATGVYFKDNWYWWSTLCEDFLKEYGVRYMTDRIDDDVEVIAWKPLPKPYESEVQHE